MRQSRNWLIHSGLLGTAHIRRNVHCRTEVSARNIQEHPIGLRVPHKRLSWDHTSIGEMLHPFMSGSSELSLEYVCTTKPNRSRIPLVDLQMPLHPLSLMAREESKELPFPGQHVPSPKSAASPKVAATPKSASSQGKPKTSTDRSILVNKIV